ncbi:DUF1294 domain-containing protein [Sphingomonas colocasiae]|uniref:DUF1294 domain-containing protein n=1 Tax=Sphingomonas colocasiae TaxID=1848973 RepID=A0ABS7PJG9_9SPHN|nr:DUF1294 domain-containing protein [Sphingomonas colocasiae]MBY8821119.1 DUF1294 domain-containing protein [Sphingomonas colocasiae]
MALIALVAALALINLFAYAQFGVDKARAQTGQRRIPESTLLLTAMIGGTIGAYAGRARFRHKTKKTSFSMKLHLIALVQAGIAAVLLDTYAGAP